MAADESHDDKTQTHVALTNGTMVSHYRIIKKIGAGGMGEVYLADDTRLKRKVALKFLPPHLCQDKDCRTRFTREAQAAARLDHPNVVTIHEVGEFQNRPFLAMQYVAGQSLKDVIKSEALSLDRIVDLAIQICEGLSKAHQSEIVHRDVKPSNVVIDVDGRPKLLDFGLAAIKDTDQLTKTGSTLGTVGYMSPEQIRGKDTDHRSDLFSLGIVLYEMIAGRLPFKGDTEAATMNSVLNEVPEPLSRYKGGVSGKLQDIVSKLLEKDPSLRYQSAAGLISDLKRLAMEQVSGSGNDVAQPSIAVLPFANLSADPEQEYFCDGMAEEIINALAHIKGLRVVARTSCFAFKGKHDDIRDIGRKLNVDHILEGSIRKSGNRVRITGQLIKIADGFHLWSDKFDRNLEDIFEIQDEISQAIAQKLEVELLGDGHEQPVKRPTENLNAYNLYLKGRFLWNKRVKPDLLKAVDCFEQAITLDPTFALGYVGLADAHIVLADHDYSNRQEHLRLAEESALTALELDGTLAEPHAALGSVKLSEWKWSEAEEEFKKALKLNPSYPTAHQWFGLFLVNVRRFELAGQYLARARELDPLSLPMIMAQSVYFYTTRQYDRAMATCQEGTELGSNPAFPLIMGWALIEKGDYTGAIDQLNLSIRLSMRRPSDEGPPPDITIFLGRAYALMGETRKAREILDDCVQEAEAGRAQPAGIAALFISLGDKDSGLEWLERSVRDSDDWFPMFSLSPVFDCLRDTPRFVALLSRIGLTDKLGEVSDE